MGYFFIFADLADQTALLRVRSEVRRGALSVAHRIRFDCSAWVEKTRDPKAEEIALSY